MKSITARAAPRTLLQIVHGVRRRWRIKLLLRGGAIVALATLAIFALSAWGLERTGFTPLALLAIRIAAYGAVVWLAFRFLVRPLARRVTDEQAALYLEEHEPELQELVLSGLELERAGPLPPLARRTVERALVRCAHMGDGRELEKGEMWRFGAALGAAVAVALALAIVQPLLLRHGAGVLLNPLRAAAASSPYSIEVEPGDTTIARGADQRIGARLRGFAASDAQVVVRTAGDSAFRRVPMYLSADSSGYEALLFDLDQPAQYFVEAGAVRSGVYRIEVVDLPYVRTLTLEYHYPAYTGRPPERVQDGGDVAALRGTVVHLFATTTVPAAAGRIVLSGGTRLPLRRDSSGAWQGEFRVEKPGLYHLELQTTEGRTVTGSREYAIDVLDDHAPTVRFAKPGRDIRPTPIDEVYLEAQAEDDYGVRSVELVYSVNGGKETTVPLFSSSKGLAEVSAGHTLYLEEMGLQPGDIVSYYARARDGTPNRPPVVSDIYFLTARPFGREYRQADSGAPPGGGGQQGAQAGQLTNQQREIVAATFNLARDSAQYTTSAFREYLGTIATMQDRLRQQVLTLAQRMGNRRVTADTLFSRMADILPRAAAAMDSALVPLRGVGPRPALPPEQQALRELERAEALYREVQVSLQQQGGGGNGASPNAEDLANLFELELDKLRNQYETVQRGAREQGQQQVDATLEKLRELARRLQQQTERARAQAMRSGSQGSQDGGGNAQAQRQLASELEQQARQLQRLSREEPRQQELDRAANELQQAADALRRAAASAANGNTAEAQQALDRLRSATQRLESQRGSNAERQARDALQRAQQLADQQRTVSRQMEEAARQATPDPRRAQELIDRRTEQYEQTQQLEEQLDRLAAGTRQDQPAASRGLAGAADAIRSSHLKEMQRFSRSLTRDGVSADAVRQQAERIDQAMDSVVGELRQAVAAFRPSDQQRVAQGLERARDLVRGLESMRERTRAATAARERQLAGQNGAPGGQQPNGQQDGQQADAGQRGGRQNGQPNGQQANGGRQNGDQANAGNQGGGQRPGQPGQQDAGERNGGQQDGRQSGGGGAPGYAGGALGSAPRTGPLTAEQQRQLREEVRQRLQDAEALRAELRRDGRDVGSLDPVLQGLRALAQPGTYASAEQLQKIQGDVLQNMKAFEFALRRAVLGESREKLYLAGSDEVPESYRQLVEEYYRSLARQTR